MTQAAKLKAVIRARVLKTGESYTAARRHVLAAKAVTKAAPIAEKATGRPLNTKDGRNRTPYGELSDRTTRQSTGESLEHWFEVLDKFGERHGHTKAAEHLRTEYKVPGWHAQMITVTWERRRGLRKENQSCTGTFQVSVSRAIAATPQWIVGFVNDPQSRKAWLKATSPALRKAFEDAIASGKSMELKKAHYARMRYKWLSSTVEIRVTGKPGGKSSIVADSSGLPDADAVPIRREAFAQALDALRDIAAA